MDKTELNFINDQLGKRYGKTIDGRNHFRLVWSEDLTEVRHGDFLEETPITLSNGQVVILEDVVKKTKEVKKYAYFCDRFVLEELVFEGIPNDIKNTENGSYEPWFVFQDKDNKPIEPTLTGIDMILYYKFNNTLKGHKPTEEELIKKRREMFKEQLDEAVPNSVHKLVHGEAVFCDSTKQKGVDNGS